jgi:hypothetical protein
MLPSKEFEDTKGVIRIRKSKDRQHNGQMKKDKRTNTDLQNTFVCYWIYIRTLVLNPSIVIISSFNLLLFVCNCRSMNAFLYI